MGGSNITKRARKKGFVSLLISTERDLSGVQSLLLLSPLLVLFFVVFVLPVLGVARTSIYDPNFTLEHYETVFGTAIYIKILFRTVWISASVALICLLLGYPVAALMVRTKGWQAALIAGCVLIPLWLSVLVRSYAWVVLLSTNGVLVSFLRDVGIISQDTRMIFTDGAVILAMVHVLLPFMILPLYANLNAIPRDLASAARGLGASPAQAFIRVTLPLSTSGIFSGCVLVFVLALGFFVTPQLVGGSNSIMASMIISREATVGNNWGLASALAMVLFSIAILIVAVFGRFTNDRNGSEEPGRKPQ